MKYTMTLMALGLSVALLTGCGGGDSKVPTNASGIQGTGAGICLSFYNSDTQLNKFKF